MRSRTTRVVWTRDAAEDLGEILEFISNDRPSAAANLYRNIKARAFQLRINPERCRMIPELSSLGLKDYREFIVSSYRVMFKLSKSRITVFAVLDGRRDIAAALERRILRQ